MPPPPPSAAIAGGGKTARRPGRPKGIIRATPSIVEWSFADVLDTCSFSHHLDRVRAMKSFIRAPRDHKTKKKKN